jgi:hypothetical protein
MSVGEFLLVLGLGGIATIFGAFRLARAGRIAENSARHAQCSRNDMFNSVGADYSAHVVSVGWLPGAPFLEHREQRAPGHFVEACLASVILFGCREQRVE